MSETVEQRGASSGMDDSSPANLRAAAVRREQPRGSASRGAPDADVVLDVRDAGKRFCRRLARSLRYGAADIARELVGLPPPRELRRDEFWAVDGVSFSLRRGECLGLIGANGAGKSTLLKMIAGLIKPDRGTITVRGRVGALIELGAGMHPLLSGRENIRLNAAILGLSRRELDARLDQIIDFAGLGEFIDAPVQSYSSGMRVRLGFAVAAHLEPDLLLIDEVLAVGDMAFRFKCYQRLSELKKAGCALVVVSHNPMDLRRVVARGLVLRRGQTAGVAPIDDALAHYDADVLSGRMTETMAATGVMLRSCSCLINGAPGEQACPGDTITWRFTIHAREATPPLRLVASLVHSELGPVCHLSSAGQSRLYTLIAGDNTLELIIQAAPFLSGSVTTEISLRGKRSDDVWMVAQPAVTVAFRSSRHNVFGYDLNGALVVNHSWR